MENHTTYRGPVTAAAPTAWSRRVPAPFAAAVAGPSAKAPKPISAKGKTAAHAVSLDMAPSGHRAAPPPVD